jgi:hypothetical protein
MHQRQDALRILFRSIDSISNLKTPESSINSDTAKKAVEMAIEEDEETAMQWWARSEKMTRYSG